MTSIGDAEILCKRADLLTFGVLGVGGFAAPSVHRMSRWGAFLAAAQHSRGYLRGTQYPARKQRSS